MYDTNTPPIKGKKVLLHCCCAPCLLGSIERLKDFSVTCFYYNPNIIPLAEYEKRLEELKKVCNIFDLPLLMGEYENERYLKAVKNYILEKEGGEKCSHCFELRLNETAKRAKKENFDYFCTTLTLSPHKNSDLINQIGFKTEKNIDIQYLPSNFKKQAGFLRSIELCKQYSIYRQNYCGCLQNNL